MALYQCRNSASNTWQLISAGFHRLLSVYWPNFITGIIILLIGIPVVMWLSSSQKNAIYAFAAGLWIIAGLLIFGVARYVARDTESNGAPRVNTGDIPQNDLASVPLQNEPPVIQPHEVSNSAPHSPSEPRNRNERPRKPATVQNRITNSHIVNSRGNVQAPGATVSVNRGRAQDKQGFMRLLNDAHSFDHEKPDQAYSACLKYQEAYKALPSEYEKRVDPQLLRDADNNFQDGVYVIAAKQFKRAFKSVHEQ